MGTYIVITTNQLLKTYILLSEKNWHVELFNQLRSEIKANWILCSTKEEFNLDWLNRQDPAMIFIPHWSHIISPDIFNNFTCIVFHMTDLPFGRGGSPLQNLIVRGYENTKISALRVTEGIDTGDIYVRHDLSLKGTAREIFQRATNVIQEMVVEIVRKDLQPQPQQGEITLFKRRKPQEGNMADLKEAKEIYDFIRMLDCEGYPNAFLETQYFRFEFTNAVIQSDQLINANVRIIKK